MVSSKQTKSEGKKRQHVNKNIGRKSGLYLYTTVRLVWVHRETLKSVILLQELKDVYAYKITSSMKSRFRNSRVRQVVCPVAKWVTIASTVFSLDTKSSDRTRKVHAI
jgi:hypothetical protein